MYKYHILSNARTSIFKYETISKMVSLSFVRNIPKVTWQVIVAVQPCFLWTNTTSKKTTWFWLRKCRFKKWRDVSQTCKPAVFFGSKQTCSNFLHFIFEQIVSLLENNTLMNNALMNKAFGSKLRFLLKFDFSNNFSWL